MINILCWQILFEDHPPRSRTRDWPDVESLREPGVRNEPPGQPHRGGGDRLQLHYLYQLQICRYVDIIDIVDLVV